MPIIQIRSSERLAIMGKTGSGKTYMARYLVTPIRRLIVLDPKGTLVNAPEWNLEEDSTTIRRKLERGGYARIRYAAPFDGNWSDILSFAWGIGNVVVYIDEVYGVVDPGTRPSRELTALYTRGRERGIGVWAASQRPAWVPLFVMSEADWIFAFRLQLEEDRRRIAQIGGPLMLAPVTDEHGFWYYNTTWDRPFYSRGLKIRERPMVVK